jgi:heme/copper-type cytochrome/quinol oxidase subunit 3
MVFFVLDSLAGGIDVLTVQLASLIASCVAFIFVGMSAFQYAEMAFNDTHYGLIESLYFILITFSTVSVIL